MLGTAPIILKSGSLFALGGSEQSSEEVNEEICRRKFQIGVRKEFAERPIGDVMVAIGSLFIGTPYIANSLEQPGSERLVINLQALDCVTFVESTLALSRCIRLRQHCFDAYKEQLQLIRYRSGVIDEYPSRLHYFSDWIHDNTEKRVVQDVTKELGGIPYEKKIEFMSVHRSAYRQLADDNFLEAIGNTETDLNQRARHFIPKQRLEEDLPAIRDGDIIAITTSTDGLDISHTGIAAHVNGTLKYLHAPLSNGTVQLTSGSLAEYLKMHKKQTGVMVARPTEP